MDAEGSPEATGPRGQLIFHGNIALKRGREWHSTAFPLSVGDVVKFTAEGTTRFFAGLFSQAEYDAARNRSPLMFPFRLGSDQMIFRKAYNIPIATDYRIVLRVSSFQKDGEIQLEVVRL